MLKERADNGRTWDPEVVTDDTEVPIPSAALPAPLTVAQIKEAELVALSHAPEDVLMDRAARAVARVVREELVAAGHVVPNARVVILAGSGRNGGDALLAGALLARDGADVTAVEVSTSSHARGRELFDAAGGVLLNAIAESGLRAADAELKTADLVIDGIAGLGGTAGLRAPADHLVSLIPSSAVVVAVDLPSGLDADSGEVTGTHVKADVTVAFTAPSWCLVTAPASEAAGRVVVADVGVDVV
jgi:hydroxyethylthiazole kinase-like uncharacterized protein yjeF